MTSPVVRPRALDIVSGVLLLAALSLIARRDTKLVSPRAPTISVVSNVVTSAVQVDSSAAVMVARNVFSATRRAPSVRFTPPGADVGVSSSISAPIMMITMSTDSMRVGTSAQVDAAPHLYGIVTEDGVRRALLLLSARGDVPRLFTVGDSSGGFRVVSIVADRVILASASGSRTLRLIARAPRDSLENLP